jgi:hypothetical protein
MTAQQYKFSALTLQLITVILVSILSYFSIRLINQRDVEETKNSMEHKEIMLKIDTMIEGINANTKEISVSKEWRRLHEINHEKSNSRGGSSSKIKSPMINYIDFVPDQTTAENR